MRHAVLRILTIKFYEINLICIFCQAADRFGKRCNAKF
ncbi:hypothetical protein CAMGR0001_0355 [Campylobacter gracilis RM3268]|uniref:Uncharacterized protein n=1 Tax=Campylobacter gracilis RM3268 TaxID=553220 RepID=C8PKY2_9BACT|nr:hypothetical protein CAMGR0001_0355 [Campylobacter gracilis RM3268]